MEKEVEEEKEYEGYTEPERCESPAPMQQEAQRSQSPFWNATSDLRQNHQEQVGSSRHQCNKEEQMEVLKSLK